jgi:hypothetical protein
MWISTVDQRGWAADEGKIGSQVTVPAGCSNPCALPIGDAILSD